MQIYNLSEKDSLLNQYLKEVRSVEIQQDSLRFRRNLERIGEILAYEVSKTFSYVAETVRTPLADAVVNTCKNQLVVASILRAGLPFHQGVLNYFDHAENAFISAYRKYNEDHSSFEIFVEYIASPNLEGKTLILCDPMLATGGSMELSYHALLSNGTPAELHVLSVIASQKAVEHMRQCLPENTTVWTAAIDPVLDEHSYIVPGLGDAGDLAYGKKM